VNRTNNDRGAALFLAPPGAEVEEHADPAADGSAEAMRRLRRPFEVPPADGDAPPDTESSGRV
jgi:hypothetical protein